MPADAPVIGFLPVAAEHLPLLDGWLRQPHMREWWGEPEEELGFIRDMVEGRDTTQPYLITVDGAPVGYIQVWYIGHYQNERWVRDHPWLLDLPAEAVGVDLSLGDPASLSRGIGSAALRAFVAGLRGEGHDVIIIDPDPTNLRAVRAYEKAGFRPIPELAAHAQHGVLLMRFKPDAEG